VLQRCHVGVHVTHLFLHKQACKDTQSCMPLEGPQHHNKACNTCLTRQHARASQQVQCNECMQLPRPRSISTVPSAGELSADTSPVEECRRAHGLASAFGSIAQGGGRSAAAGGKIASGAVSGASQAGTYARPRYWGWRGRAGGSLMPSSAPASSAAAVADPALAPPRRSSPPLPQNAASCACCWRERGPRSRACTQHGAGAEQP